MVRTERTKTIPCPAAHVWIGHIREFPPPPQGLSVHFLRQKKFKKFWTIIVLPLIQKLISSYLVFKKSYAFNIKLSLAVTREGGLLV